MFLLRLSIYTCSYFLFSFFPSSLLSSPLSPVFSSHPPLLPAEVLVPIVINLDVTDRSGKTALHHAAFNGHLEMLSLLQLKGANVRAMDRRDKTALHFAAFMGMCGRI